MLALVIIYQVSRQQAPRWLKLQLSICTDMAWTRYGLVSKEHSIKIPISILSRHESNKVDAIELPDIRWK